MAWPIVIGGPAQATYSKRGAQQVLAGFAFGTKSLGWPSRGSAPAISPLGPPPPIAHRGRWAYQAFDCALASPQGLSIEDITITAAVDSRLGSEAILGMMSIADVMTSVLAEIPVTQTFWDLTPSDVAAPPLSGTIAWHVWRAWELLMGLPGVNVAITHKTLHHKRPWLFPVLDEKTRKAMGGKVVWPVIHKDLTRYAFEFEELERWFATLASHKGGVQLTRLRIHDILLWGCISRNGAGLPAAGRGVLGGGAQPPPTGPTT